MTTPKPKQTLADYVTIALSPALIMTLIGSLIFFLVEVIHGGRGYEGRLLWTLSWFIFGMVLVCRMSMHPAVGERARLYGLVLGLLVWLGLQRFLSFDYLMKATSSDMLRPFEWLLNLGWIVLIWWCASKLTWDCTYIDDQVDASGKGVLEAAALDEEAPDRPEDEAEPEVDAKAEAEQLRGMPGILAWWERYRRYRERQGKRPHTPGVWVVYFSLAALPLFGLGQALIPPEAEDRRRYTFWLMVVYVTSGLGLLLTTCFLGLRRYLRQRKLQMPVAVTGVWMAVGGFLIFALVVAGAVLPRPNPEYHLLPSAEAKTRDRAASRYAMKGDGAGKGEGRASTDKPQPGQKAEQGSGTKTDKQGRGQKSGKSGQGSSQNSSGQKGSSSDNRQGKQGDSNDNSKGKPKSDTARDKSNQQRKADSDKSRNDDKQQRDGESRSGDSEKDKGDDKDNSDGNRESDSDKRDDSPRRSSSSGLFDKLSGLATVLKWVVFVVLGLAFLFFLFRSGLRFLANFTDWARNLLDALRAWWEGLFSRRAAEGVAGAVADDVPMRPRPRPFALFRNPFLDGSADHLSPDELACYSFEAFEAWAWEHGAGRGPEETPLEFAERLSEEYPAMEADARRVAGLYARVAYARGKLTPGSLGPLRQFWQSLDSLASHSLSRPAAP